MELLAVSSLEASSTAWKVLPAPGDGSGVYLNHCQQSRTDFRLFMIEGMATVVVGIVAFFLLPSGSISIDEGQELTSDFPDSTKWLTPEEKRLAQIRLAVREDLEEHVDHKVSIIRALKDPKTWVSGHLVKMTTRLTFSCSCSRTTCSRPLAPSLTSSPRSWALSATRGTKCSVSHRFSSRARRVPDRAQS